MIQVGERAPAALREAMVVDAEGHRVPFAQVLGRVHGPVLVVLLREFGCISCAEQVHDLAPRLGELLALGVRVVLVGNGRPESLAAFLDRHALADKPAELLTDPTLSVYRAVGLPRSVWATHGPGALVDFLRALGRGHRPGRIDGDLRQQGGSLLIDEDGVVVWAHENARMGDHPDPSDVVEAVLALRFRSAPVPV